MDARVLGHVEAGNGARTYALGGPTQRRVFAALVARRGEVVDVSALVDVCWPTGSPPDRADHNIRTYVHRLRNALQDDGERLETIGTGYRLRLEPGELDLERFEELAGIARRGVSTGDTVGALDALDAANDLWTGRPYGEFADEPWAIAEVARLTEAHAALDESQAEALLAVGRAADAVVLMERVVRDEPLRERPRALLMRSLYESGRQAEALRAFQDFRRYMIDEAGIDPSPALVALDRQIASGQLAPPDAGPIVGNYELHERIGEGAFAVVHRATQASLDREVAVKIVRAELANRPEFIRRFEAEAQMVARIEHPHVVPLYDYWREPDRAYLVMRFMSGGSLEKRVDAGPWSVEATATLVDQIASALDAAHTVGVVHRDVKPANIMFDDADRAFLGDFGIALTADERARPEAALSEGSPVFASPEQLRREPVGPEADVHALGIVAFTLLAGRTPFADSADEPAMLRRQLHDPIPSLRDHRSELPPAVDDVLATATAKQPSERYPTASAFAEAFRAAGTSTPSSVSAPRAVRPRSNPYKGLRAFDETDAADFHGRDRLVDELIDRLARPDDRMLAVVGPSGSGKSSVVRAGLLPALRAGRVSGSAAWFTTTMIPGPRPFEALETALLRVAVNPPAALLDQLRDGDRGILRAVKRIVPDDDGVVVIVIDQFEELFTAGGADADRDQFLRALTVAAAESGSPVRILLTLRADFYDRPLRHPEFAPLLKQHTVVVTPLAPDELEHAVVTPAATVGVDFEPGLVAEIVADVNHEPGALPLLQYALTQVFDATDGDTITIEQYRAIGGLTGALGRRAEALFLAADTGVQLAARRLFGRLVTLGEGTEDTRRRIRRTELGTEPATAAAIDRFGHARLLTFDRDPGSREPTVEIAHEALIRGWSRLHGWLDEDRDGLRIHRHLTDTAAAWIGSGRDGGELYRGARLEAAVAWSPEAGDDLNDAEREFLAASVAAHDAEEDAERARFEQQVATNRRLRTMVAVVTAIAVLAAAIGIFALQQRNRADDEAAEALTQASAADEARQDAEAARADADRNADAAEAERGRAESSARTAEEEAGAARTAEQQADVERLRAAARAIAAERPALGALLAVEAYRQDPSNASIDVLHRVLTAVPGLRETVAVPDRSYARAELVDDTTLIAAGLTLDLWDLPTRSLRASIELPEVDRPPLLSVSVDGRMAAVATGADRVTIVDVDAEQVLTTFVTGAALTDISIDPVGTAVAVGRQDGTVGVWSLPDATETLQIDIGGEVRLVRWSPSDAAIATVTNTSTVQFWDAATGVERWASSTGDDDNILTAVPTGAIFSPQGDLFVVDSGLLNPILRTYATEDGSVAFPPMRRTDGDTGNDILFWRDAEQHHLVAGTAKNIATYDLANGVEVGERITEIAINDAVLSSSLGEFIAVANGLTIRSADGSGPLETVIPLSDEQRRALDAGGSVHPAIADDGSRVMLSTFLDADIPAATAFDMTTTAPTPIPAPIDRRMPFGNGAFTMTFGLDPPGFVLLDADDEPVGEFPLSFDTIDQDASADGRFVALSHSGGTVDLYTGTGELLHVFDLELQERLSGAIVIPSLTDDGRFLVASGAGLTNNRPIAIWSTDTFDRVDDGQFAGQTRAAGNLVANRLGGVVRLYSLPELDQVGQAMLNQSGGQFYPALDADHGRLAVTSLDTVTLYDIATGQQIGRPLPYRPIRIEYSADGSRLVVGSGDRVTVWNYDTDTWIDTACRVAGRNLTPDEWEQLGPRTIEYRATCEQYPIDD